jgi:hypothetical protein
MPLDATSLKSTLVAIATDPPGSALEAAGRWADAAQAYASTVLPAAVPGPVAAATAVLRDALAIAFAGPDAAEAMDAAFQVFGAAVAAGISLTGVFTPTSPQDPVGFVALFENTMRDTAAQGGEDIGDAIDAWMKSGTAVPLSGGTLVQWE